MRKLIFMIVATALFTSCEKKEIELLEPTKTEQAAPGNEPNESNNFNNNKYWLLYKTGKYELYNRVTKTVGQYIIDDAERLLRMPATQWEIPAGAPYVFNFNTGLKFDKKLIK